MNIQIFRHRDEWIVLNESYEITFHRSLSSAMSYAAAEIGTSNRYGASQQSDSTRHYS